MILKDNLYKIEGISEDRRSFRLSLIADSVIYRAHFPGHPVTPGVCILRIADEIMEDFAGRSLVPEKVINAKFLNVIDPLETPEVTYTIRKITEEMTEGWVKVQIDVLDKERVYSKLSIQYRVL